MAILNKIKNKVIDVTSDVLSAPARIKAKATIKKSTSQFKDARMVNEMRNVPDKGNSSDPLFRARANFSNMKMDNKNYEREYAKRMSGKSTRY